MANPNHDERGRFSSGSASGDHAAGSPSRVTRNVPGHPGPIARSQVVARHSNTASVGTEPRLSAAARDSIIRGKFADQRAYPVRSDSDIALKQLMQQPHSVSPGRFSAKKELPGAARLAQVSAMGATTASVKGS